MKKKILDAKTNFVLRMLIQEVINEYGDLKNIIPFEINKVTNFDYSFKVSDEIIASVIFEPIEQDKEYDTYLDSLDNKIIASKIKRKKQRKIFNIEYSINGKTKDSNVKTSLSVYNRVLKTVCNILQIFIETADPDLIQVMSINDLKENQFFAIIAQNIEKIPNWSYSKSNFRGIVLFNKKSFK